MTHTAEAARRSGAAGPHQPRASIAVTVNGEPRELAAGATVAALLAEHGLDPRLVVVEHNRVILRDRDALASVALTEGDVLELVHFVGGG